MGNQQRGIVSLVGSGPGALDLLTLRACDRLRQADVIIYDALTDADALSLAPSTCVAIDVGKRGGQPSTPQAEINQLLVHHAVQGKRVVRLKSGDPFIFGRAAAEIEALQQAGCAYEVIPGLSSVLSAPLLASIPLTDPVLSQCFAVFSAHDPDSLNWEALEQIETLVIVMGTRHLDTLIERLVDRGRSPQTPVAIIQWASYPHQKIWTGTLATILQKTSRQSLSPAVIVIGEVVGLRPYLHPPDSADPPSSLPATTPDITFPSTSFPTALPSFFLPPPSSLSSPMQPSPTATAPLSGKTILVTRAAGQSSQFSEMLQAQGAAVVEMPALEIRPPSSWDRLDEAIAHLDDFDWLILTSANGVDYFWERLEAAGKDSRALASTQLAVVGKKTAAALAQRGLRPDFIPPDYVADSLVAHFPPPKPWTDLKILFPRVESGGRQVLVQELTQQGATVVEVPAYESGCPEAIAPDALAAFQQGTLDVVTFASSKTVRCFCQLLQAAARDKVLEDLTGLATGFAIASIGPQTSDTCRELLGRVDIEAQHYTLDGLTQALIHWANQHVSARPLADRQIPD